MKHFFSVFFILPAVLLISLSGFRDQKRLVLSETGDSGTRAQESVVFSKFGDSGAPFECRKGSRTWTSGEIAPAGASESLLSADIE